MDLIRPVAVTPASSAPAATISTATSTTTPASAASSIAATATTDGRSTACSTLGCHLDGDFAPLEVVAREEATCAVCRHRVLIRYSRVSLALARLVGVDFDVIRPLILVPALLLDAPNNANAAEQAMQVIDRHPRREARNVDAGVLAPILKALVIALGHRGVLRLRGRGSTSTSSLVSTPAAAI